MHLLNIAKVSLIGRCHSLSLKYLFFLNPQPCFAYPNLDLELLNLILIAYLLTLIQPQLALKCLQILLKHFSLSKLGFILALSLLTTRSLHCKHLHVLDEVLLLLLQLLI